MIGGLVIDALALAAIVAFAWAGRQLGGVASVARTGAAIAALVVSTLLRDPVGGVVKALIGTSEDFARLLGMLLVGTGSYLAASRIYDWWLARRVVLTDVDGDGEPEQVEVDAPGPGRLATPVVATAAGGLLGLGWAIAFIAVLVLLPSDGFSSRAAIDSVSGGALVRQEGVLRWLNDGFPHYTQALPKGQRGVVVGERDDISMHGEVEAKPRPEDIETLLRTINGERLARSLQTLNFNPDVAGVARRHALALAGSGTLSYRSPGGGTLDARVLSALGEASGAFEEEIGVEVAWAAGPANAALGILDDDRSAQLIHEKQWSEIGIGVADAGWFNGRVYVVLLVAQLDEGATGAAAAAGA